MVALSEVDAAMWSPYRSTGSNPVLATHNRNFLNGVFHETTCMLFYGVPPTCVRTCAYTLWPVCRIYYVNMPIRVGIHICVGAGRKDVG